MKKPCVSVIIPVYNVERYLHRCVQSVLRQTLKDIEVILVDDGSPDNCPSLCDEYARSDNRVKVVHKNNEGLGFARNSGMAQATGKYVAFVDGDDFVDERMYQTLYARAETCGLDTVFGGICFRRPDGSLVPRREVKSPASFTGRREVDGFLLDLVAPRPECPNDVKYLVSACRAIYSKEIIDRRGLAFVSERVFLSEDILFNIDYLSAAERVCYLPDAFYYYCQNAGSLTHTYKDEKYERAKTLVLNVEKRLSALMSEERYREHCQRFRLFHMRAFLFMALRNHHPGQALRIMSDPFWRKAFEGYPLRRMRADKRCFYSVLNLINRATSRWKAADVR